MRVEDFSKINAISLPASRGTSFPAYFAREDAREWYAQDSAGNVWYFGEDTVECKNGEVAKGDGFEAGVDGAQPGVIMPADPQAGLTFRKSYVAGEAEDSGEVFSLAERVEVPAGKFRSDVLLIKETTPLEPVALEYAFYAEDVGPVLVLVISGESAREELLRYDHGQQVELPAGRDRCGLIPCAWFRSSVALRQRRPDTLSAVRSPARI